MRAAVVHGKTGPQDVTVEELPDPTPADGEVLVRVRAAALNRRDLFITHGLYPGVTYPGVLGSDGSGQVAAVGPGVDLEVGADVVIDPTLGWHGGLRSPGPKVFTILGVPRDGTLADYVVVPVTNVYPKPAHLSFEDAAALPLAGLTAYRAVVTRGAVGPGTRVLVPGVGGGVATLAVQIASALGAEVVVTSGSEEKIEHAQELGAVGGVSYRQDGWQAQLKELVGSVDVVIDTIGGPFFKEFIRLLGVGGTLVSIGATAGPVPEFVLPTVFLKHIDILGTAMGSPQEFAEMLEFFGTHELRPLVARRFPLEDAVAALELMDSGQAMGKIVLAVA